MSTATPTMRQVVTAKTRRQAPSSQQRNRRLHGTRARMRSYVAMMWTILRRQFLSLVSVFMTTSIS